MLEPERRALFLEALKPPDGYVFDRAIGSTFTLDLLALLVTPVAFALYDVEADDGATLANPVAVLESLRRHAGAITVFHQAGAVVAPSAYRAAYGFLERSVVAVRARRSGGIFHPKVWVVRYRSQGAPDRYRLLCMSRNLTFDRSWDTVLQLEGGAGSAPRPQNEPLADFLKALPSLAITKVEGSVIADVAEMAKAVATVEWDALPDGLQVERFWPLGHDRQTRDPFAGTVWRMLVVSPFASPGGLARVVKGGRGDVLVTRAETLDELGVPGASGLGSTFVLNPDAVAGHTAAEPTAAGDGSEEAVDDSPGSSVELLDLHAKLYVADGPWWSRIWTGSANATDQGLERNVEFLTELRGRNTIHGVAAILEQGKPSQPTFGSMLLPYELPSEAVEQSAEEAVLMRLEGIARGLGELRYNARVQTAASANEDLFEVTLRGEGNTKRVESALRDRVTVSVRPASLGQGHAVEPTITGTSAWAEFRVSFTSLTAFYVFELRARTDDADVVHSFTVTAELIGAPENRLDRILANELRSRSDLIKLLLILLGSLEPAFGDVVDIITGEQAGGWDVDPLLGSEALLEPLLRASSRDSTRLSEIERLVSQLSMTDEGLALLPDGWVELWAAVRAAVPPKGKNA